MTTLQGQIEKMARDITSGPDISDSIEVAVVGAALGALVGYVKERDGGTAKSFAAWGAGLGIAGQYLLFHMLRPTVRRTIGGMYRVGQTAPTIPGNIDPSKQVCIQPIFPCPKGQEWSDWDCKCIPSIPPPPAVATGWADGDEYVGAVAGIGGFRGGQMPFGPGPWPTQDAGNPGELGW
ncbi:MAG TPA: hypothetical protein VMN82_05660 [Thermoanaerobaculia bacterium]|nr:hypothetical protein [Thermoanaerobaculia bacterium]